LPSNPGYHWKKGPLKESIEATLLVVSDVVGETSRKNDHRAVKSNNLKYALELVHCAKQQLSTIGQVFDFCWDLSEGMSAHANDGNRLDQSISSEDVKEKGQNNHCSSK
jgi:hypothetical protein